MRKDGIGASHYTLCYLSQDPNKSSATLFPKSQALSLRLPKPERASSSVEKSIGAAFTMPFRHKSSLVLIAQFVVVAASIVVAQTAANTTAPKPATAGTLTVQDIVKMSKAGLDDEVIIQQIRKNGQAFDLTTDQLIELKSNSVSNRVLQVMQDPSRAGAMQGPAPAAARAPSAEDSGLPSEVGVYVKTKSEWVEVMPEVVNWKTGGVMKSVDNGGLVIPDV